MPANTKLKSSPVLKTRAAVEAVLNDTVALQIERESLVATRDARLLAIKEEHEPEIDALAEQLESNLALLEQWSNANRAEFGDAQSITINGHRLGYRLGQPTVKPAGKLKFPAIIKIILAKGGDLLRKYIRVKHELNKEAILETGRLTESGDATQRELAATELSAIGVEIEQAESFYLDPDRAGQADVMLKKEAA